MLTTSASSKPGDDVASDSPPLSIVHITAPGDFGGLERIVQTLASGQRAAGHSVHVVAVLDRGAGHDHPFVTSLHRSAVPVTPVEFPPRAYLRERRIVREILAGLAPDVVHTHGYRANLVDAPVARRLGIPSVTTVHGFTGGGVKNRTYERLQIRSFRRFDAVIAVARPLARRLLAAGVPRERLHVVPNAWVEGDEPLTRAAARRALELPAELFRIGWVGRLSREKGADVLVAALRHLGDLPVGVSFLGDGRDRVALETSARKLRVADRITWHGPVPNASRYFTGFDVFVLSSRTEGTPVALFEAMAARVPVVATAVGGVPDVVTSAEAVVVPPDDPVRLARGIRAVFEDPTAARERAEAARMHLASHFGAIPWLARYEAVYAAVCARRA